VMDQSPFYYVLAWASIHLFGESEAALRLPSLIAVGVASLVVAFGAFRLGGSKAAVTAGSLFWLCFPTIWTSLDARPYGLALLCGAIAVAGFIGACRSGRVGDRLLWIAGAASLIWTHYVFLPFLAGLGIAYIARPLLRRRYPLRLAALDVFAILALVAPAVPGLIALVQTRQSQQWMFEPRPWAAAAPILPFVLAAWWPTGRRPIEDGGPDLRRALCTALAFQYGALATAYLFGLTLIESRYTVVVLVAAAVLSGDTLARLSLSDAVAPLTAFVVATVVILVANDRVQGSPSTAGFQEWRQAVAALRGAESLAPGAPVLFRSGNAEDDLSSPGEIRWPASLAPLRSPGQSPPAWNVVLLTYTWNSAARARYFDDELVRRLKEEPVVFLICLSSSEPGANGYCGNVVAWVGTTWPGRFHGQSLGSFRFLTVMRFDRRP
jgi:hypothetical protein